ncbi:hypothetical protein N7481_002304 [Penicillium waksmanii]|uniref:uncharacterized protein n=1 Tax=Penicillium waksmanii TaxID=69791 RepID=UPI0025482ACC|nr:uncharacterized protein N7481_002304 [Penicillium waksmanii]KAJ5995327.1 hypothetical protein N7481_002304 [Penicillium waksmanii]
MIYPPTFHSKYNEWWTLQENTDGILEGNISDEDVDFGLLILRVCLLSVQCLPHTRYPTAGILDVSLDHLEEWFYSLANEIEKTQSAERKPTIITVQHRFYHVCYLGNYAKIRKCWAALSVTVKDAHEMGLHLKDPGIPLDDLSMEIRRRAFWNLYVIDRFMCTLFGYWPLIPEGYFDIDLPHDSLRTITIRPYILTTFTDRIFYIKVARYLTAFTSPPSWTTDQYDPVLVSEFAQRFKEVVVDQLPPAYWLENPDTRWDAAEPTLLPKRETLHLFIYSAKASLYRAFADPCNNLHYGSNTSSRYGTDLLALSHRRTLMDVSCKVISSITRLYVLAGDDEGGTCEQMFLFPILLVEALACLGVCLLSIQADTRQLSNAGIRFSPDSDLRYSYATFFDAFGLLSRQAPQYGIAKQGLSILEGLHGTLQSSSASPSLLRIENYRTAATGSETHAAGGVSPGASSDDSSWPRGRGASGSRIFPSARMASLFF